jgi:hypothetical protein
MVPTDLTTRWEVAYRRYCAVAGLAASAGAGDQVAARALAATSRDVAAAWRELQKVPDLPWWVLAAVSAAAEAFESQAADWGLRVPRLQVAGDDPPTAPLRQLGSDHFVPPSIVDESRSADQARRPDIAV